MSTGTLHSIRDRGRSTPPHEPDTAAALASFFLLTYALAWTAWAFAARVSAAPSTLLQAAATFAPSAAAVVIVAAHAGRGGLRHLMASVTRWRVRPGWYAAALAGPPVLMAVAMAMHVALGGRLPSFPAPGRWTVLPALFLLVFAVGGPLGEELGWRGYALPALTRRLGFSAASVLVGVFWAGWHLPLRWFPGTPQHQVPLLLSIAQTIAVSVILGWMYYGTGGSLPVVALAHASINTWAGPLRVLPDDAGSIRPYLLATLLVALAAGAILVHARRRRNE